MGVNSKIPPVAIMMDKGPAPWFQSSAYTDTQPRVWARGSCFIGGQFVEGQKLVDAISSECAATFESDSLTAAKNLIPTLNGAWAAVLTWPGGRSIAAVNRYRSIPLFYSVSKSRAAISNSVEMLIKQLNKNEVNNVSALEFLMCGYVTGSETLFDGIRQVQPGEFVELIPSPSVIETCATQYFQFMGQEDPCLSESDLEEEFESVLTSIFQKTADALAGSKVVIPLSGGSDSRLIAAMFKKVGYENVLCYTYGSAAASEVELSQRVAKALGYPWHYVEYSGAKWQKYMNSQSMIDYWLYACQGTSLPVFQELPALSELIERYKADSSWTVMPGFVGDLVAGNHTPHSIPIIPDWSNPAAALAKDKHYCLWEVSKSSWNSSPYLQLKEKLLRTVHSADMDAQGLCWSYIEWEYRSRMSLFLVNATRIYDFMGVNWMHPIGDYAYTNFFLKVPLRYRYKKRLFINTLRERICRGNLEELAKIPRDSGPWERITDALPPEVSPRETLKSRLARPFRNNPIYYAMKRAQHRARPDSPCAFEWWFSNGRRPEDVSVAHALEQYRVKELISPDVLKPFLKHQKAPSSLATCNGLLAVAVLATLISRARCG